MNVENKVTGMKIVKLALCRILVFCFTKFLKTKATRRLLQLQMENFSELNGATHMAIVTFVVRTFHQLLFGKLKFTVRLLCFNTRANKPKSLVSC